MTGADLLAEMETAAARMRSIHFEGLKSLGVQMAVLGSLSACQHTVGMATIEDAGGGIFQPSPDGFPVCLVAVVWPEARRFGDAGLFDLVAFRSGDPRKWWLRCGSAFALGEHLLDQPDPLRVVRTPADWLAAGGNALCVLDWSENSPAWSALRVGPPLLFPDEAMRQQVRASLVRAAPLPPMEIAA